MELVYDQIMTADEAATLLAVSRRQMFVLEREFGLPCHRIGSVRGARRYFRSELVAWLAAQPATPTAIAS